MASPTAGSRIAPHLTLRSVLGSGGTATVFEAFHARLQAPVAVKICMVDGEHGPEADARLVREARLCARLTEPCFPRIYDIARLEDGRPYYVMEKVLGPTLDVYAAALNPDLDTSLDVVRQLLQALRAAHDHGVVHRDVKPENVILEEALDGSVRVRLVDFGIALLEGEADIVPEGLLVPEVLGTPGYMPREQVCGEPVDARSDLHAAGVILYELVARRLPFDDDEPVALMERTRAEAVPDVRFHAPDCPPQVAEWISRATAHDPADRFQDAREALAELPRLETSPLTSGLPRPSEPLSTQRPPPKRPEPAASPRAPERTRRPLRPVALAAALLLAASSLAWLWPETPGDPAASAPAGGAAALAEEAPPPRALTPVVESMAQRDPPFTPVEPAPDTRTGSAVTPSGPAASPTEAAGVPKDAPRAAPALAARARGPVTPPPGARPPARTRRRTRPVATAQADAVETPRDASHPKPNTGTRGTSRPARDPQLGIPENPYGAIPENPY